MNARGSSPPKAMFVNSLVSSAVALMTAIWPQSAGSGSMPLRKFVQESLKRSRSSYSVFQVAVFYLAQLRWKQHHADLPCGRRAFLSALMVASKYLQDRNYSIKAWSTISGLKASELAANELDFLKALDWQVHVRPDVFDKWSRMFLDLASIARVQLETITKVDEFDLKHTVASTCIDNSTAKINTFVSTTIKDQPEKTDKGTRRRYYAAYPTPVLSDGSDIEDDQRDDDPTIGTIGKRSRNDEDNDDKALYETTKKARLV
uniref:ARAD1D19778p n=1 Tax=Blastobotrys adeninivorans TaxID=409370 RepID=A0A060T9M9_BLAAD